MKAWEQSHKTILILAWHQSTCLAWVWQQHPSVLVERVVLAVVDHDPKLGALGQSKRSGALGPSNGFIVQFGMLSLHCRNAANRQRENVHSPIRLWCQLSDEHLDFISSRQNPFLRGAGTERIARCLHFPPRSFSAMHWSPAVSFHDEFC
jgi:hypothetical protein